MIHIVSTVLAHVWPVPTSFIQKILRANLQDYHLRSRTALSRQERPSHSVLGGRGQKTKGGKLTIWKKLCCAFYLQGRMAGFSPSIWYNRHSLWGLPSRFWQNTVEVWKIQRFSSTKVFGMVNQVSSHINMPNEVNKQICGKVLGYSHYFAPESQMYLNLILWLWTSHLSCYLHKLRPTNDPLKKKQTSWFTEFVQMVKRDVIKTFICPNGDN